MERLSDYSRTSILLTLIALFLVAASTWGTWYTVEPSGGRSSYYLEPSEEIVHAMRFLATIWFFASLIFASQVLLGETSLVRDFPIGTMLVAVGMLTFLYAVFSLPTVDGDYELKVGGGIGLVGVAFVVQTLSVVLHLWGAFASEKSIALELEPYEAPVAEEPPGRL